MKKVTLEGDKIDEFAAKKGYSANWIRTLVKRGLIKARLIGPPASPVPYYLIPPGTEVPKMRQGRPPKKSQRSKSSKSSKSKAPA